MYYQEPFTEQEKAVLTRFFTNTDRPVFALIHLPEVVKGALFARYSRSPKSVRRLFLDEFLHEPELGISAMAEQMPGEGVVKTQRAERLYDRIFTEYGDDSVAQLGGVHLACEQASNLLTKILERGRLGAYLEQSTRYIFYDQKLGDRYRYLVPPEVRGSEMESLYTDALEHLFTEYSDLVRELVSHFEEQFPRTPADSELVWRSTIRAKACDTARGLLPAATLSNVGIFATAQSYEQLLLKMRAHPLGEAREYAQMMLEELRKTIPAFLRRVDRPDRGGAWTEYLAKLSRDVGELAAGLVAPAESRPEVTLIEWDPEAEVKVAAAALYPHSALPDDQLLRMARELSADERRRIILTAAGERGNRRHKPGREFERSFYRFDLLTDFGIFRDLQRHRMLTIEWQRLSTDHGYVVPQAVRDVGRDHAWSEAMDRADGLFRRLLASHGPDVAQYAVPFAHRIRYSMQLNAREAMHLLELRTGQGGHPDYRRVCQTMHQRIRDQAGHHAIADAMKFVDYASYDLDRLESERRAEQRRRRSNI